MSFFDQLNLPKFDFTLNLSGGRIIKFQQSEALTSHFESFWSIVSYYKVIIPILLQKRERREFILQSV